MKDGVRPAGGAAGIEEQRLRDSEERYRALVDMSPDAVLLLQEGRIAFVNATGARLYGASDPSALIGTPILERVPPEMRALVSERVRSLMERGEAVPPAEITQLRVDGSRFLAEVRSSPLHVAGRPGSVTVVRDVTARRQAEDEVRRLAEELEQRVNERTAQLQAANRDLEAFNYSVAHDLQAPLRALNSFSTLLAAEGGALSPAARRHLERIKDAAVRMTALVGGLLQLSRVTRATLRREPVDLSAAAAEILQEMRAAEPARRVEAAIAPGLVVEGDAALLRQVLQNLIENAWKFTSGRSDAQIEVGVEGDGRGNRYFVRDNGVGFDMGEADGLFELFSRLHAGFPGNGIGLATVKRIIAGHGGRAWADGAVGKGATFYFTFGRG